VQETLEAMSLSSLSTVIGACVFSVHVGHCEEHLAVRLVLGDGKPALQGWAAVLTIIPIDVCHPLQGIPQGLTDPAHPNTISAQ
jgi:hypothetical protein